MHETCDHDATHVLSAISRRSALAAVGSAVIGAAVLGTSACSSAESPQGAPSTEPPSAPPPTLPDNALITLEVQAGPPPVPDRYGISTALKIGNDTYLIDCGLGSLNAFTNAGLKFSNLKTMFITHLHTDHIVDYYSFFLSGGGSAKPGQRQ